MSLKKVFLSCIACLSLIIPLSVNASAELNYPDMARVVDDADLLTDGEEQALENKIAEITKKYDFDVVIVTADTLEGQSPMAYADDFYDYNGYGAGNNYDGVLLLVSMEDRDWWISTKGFGIKAFTDYGIQKAGDEFKGFLTEKKYSEGFETFLNITDEYVKAAKDGKPYDTNNKYRTQDDVVKGVLIAIAVGLGIGLVAAFIVVMIFKSQLKSVAFQKNADCYEVEGSMNVTRSHDMFLYRSVKKTAIPQSSGGGGSSTHHSSSGSSHGGGGGKF